MPNKRKKQKQKQKQKEKDEEGTSYTFPLLHDNVADAVSAYIPQIWFNHQNDMTQRNYSTHVMGKFKCDNGGCSNHGWGSKKVAILIRGYSSNGYNAIVFNQRCLSCNQLGTLTLDATSYVDRVAYRLQKWAGVEMEEQPYTRKKGLPHEEEFCEGCKRGLCR